MSFNTNQNGKMYITNKRLLLLSQGVVKSLGQVAYEVEHVFGFYQYAETHQPKPEPEPIVQEWDMAIARGCPNFQLS